MKISSLTEDSKQDVSRLQRLALTSKLESLKNQVENLLQKKIRIDLEIKRTRKKLSSIQKEAQSYLRTSIQLEGADPDSNSPEDYQILLEAWNLEQIQEYAQLEIVINEVTTLLQAYEDIPLYQE